MGVEEEAEAQKKSCCLITCNVFSLLFFVFFPVFLDFSASAYAAIRRGVLKDNMRKQTHSSSAFSFTHTAAPVSSLSMTNAEDLHEQQDGPTLEM